MTESPYAIDAVILDLYDQGVPEDRIAHEAALLGTRRTDGRRLSLNIVRRAIVAREIRQRIDGGASRRRVAEEFGVSTKTIDRAILADAPRRYSDAEWERVRVLAAEGMPAAYIADDLDRGRGNLREEVVKRGWRQPDGVSEWSRAWLEIRKDPIMLAMHHEFFPTAGARA